MLKEKNFEYSSRDNEEINPKRIQLLNFKILEANEEAEKDGGFGFIGLLLKDNLNRKQEKSLRVRLEELRLPSDEIMKWRHRICEELKNGNGHLDKKIKDDRGVPAEWQSILKDWT